MGGAKGVLDEGLKQILRNNAGALSGVHGALVSATGNKETRVILVTSCHAGEGKTVTAVGLAYALSNRASAQVLLVDGNFAHPELHSHFGIPLQPGLADYLSGAAGLEETIALTDEPRLKVMPFGSGSAPLFDAGHGRDNAQRITSLRQQFDYVICDGRPVFGVTDALAGASGVDGIVLVVECERTRWEVAQDAKERLTKAGGNVIGVVLNKRKYYIPEAMYIGA